MTDLEQKQRGEIQELRAKNEELESTVRDLKEALEAIHHGEADPAIVSRDDTGKDRDARLKDRIPALGGAGAAVEAERQRLYDVLEMLPAYVVLLSADYHVPFANRYFRERFGESFDRRCYEYLFQRNEPCENCETYKVMKMGAPHHWEWLGPDNHYYDIYDYPFRDTDGSNLIMEVGIDITEQKKAHEELKKHRDNLETRISDRTQALRESEGRLRILYESMTEGLANYEVVYEDGKAVDYLLTGVNPAFERITGLARGDAVGRRASELYGTGSPPFLDVYARVASGGGPEHFETYFPPMKQHFSVSAFSPGKGKFATVFTDITERKRAEEALRGSEEKYRIIVETANEGIWITDADRKTAFVNQRMVDMLGYSVEEMLGKTPSAFLGTGQEQLRKKTVEELKTGIHTQREFKFRRKDGSDLWGISSATPVFDDEGRYLRTISMLVDITDRKLAEEALRESEERYRILVDSAPDAILVHSEGKVLYANPAAVELYGAASLDELKARNVVTELVPPEDIQAARDRVRRLEEGRRLPMREATILRLDGRRVPAEVVSSSVQYGGIRATQSILRDVTERKLAEERIAHLASFPELNPNPVLELDLSGEVIYTNAAVARTLENLGLGNNIGAFLPEGVPYILPRVLEGDVVSEIRVGGRVFVETITLTPQTRTIRIYARDITDRKQAEEELRETSQYLENLFNYANAPIIVWDPQFRITRFNHAFERLTGRTAEEVTGKNLEILFPTASAADSMDHIRRVMTGERWETVEIPILHKDGGIRTVLWNSATLYEADGKTVSSAIAQGQDITERKLAEQALADTSQYLENLLNYANAPIIVWDPQFRINRFNRAFERLTGRTAEEVLGKGLEILFPAETAADSMDHIRRVMTGERWEVVEIPILQKDGGIRTVLWNSATLYEADGKTVSSAIAQGQDITERKWAEEELRETSQYLENLLNYANAPIIVWDPKVRITGFNQAFERLTGRTAEEVLGKGLELLFPAESVETSMDHIRRVMAGERWEVVEIPILQKDGGIRTVLWNSATLYEADGKTVSSAIAQGQDITERKKMEGELAEKAAELQGINVELKNEISHRKNAEETVRKTLSLLHAALESTADAMLVIDRSGRITGYNQNLTTMWNIPDSVLHTLDTRAATEYLSVQVKDPDGFLDRLKEISDHPTRQSYDMLDLLDGRIIERYSKPQKIGNSIVGRVFSFRDITERRHAEERLMASLDEKEVLLREIHHRVKNNLQLTSSLLDMTRMRTRDPGTGSILTDVMMKIQTMAQIHTRLYESKVFDRINMEATVREQIAAVSNIYSGRKTEITSTLTFPEIYMPIDQAIPCALVLNELLSNAYKHAFKGRKAGRVEITGTQEDGRIRITVRDDGVGMPERFDINKASSLGLKLVRNLVQQQLKGTLEIKRDRGTEVIVELPIQTPEREDVKDTGS